MHRDQADLGAVSDSDEDECDLHEITGAAQLRGSSHQRLPVQRSEGWHSGADGSEIQRDGSEERERDSHGADDQIFPAGFDCAFGVVETDEQG